MRLHVTKGEILGDQPDALILITVGPRLAGLPSGRGSESVSVPGGNWTNDPCLIGKSSAPDAPLILRLVISMFVLV